MSGRWLHPPPGPGAQDLGQVKQQGMMGAHSSTGKGSEGGEVPSATVFLLLLLFLTVPGSYLL